MRQVLLVVSAGSLVKSLPVMAVAYFSILRAWSRSVHTLSTLHVCAFTTHSMSTSSDDDSGDDDGVGDGVGAEPAVILSSSALGDISPTSPLTA